MCIFRSRDYYNTVYITIAICCVVVCSDSVVVYKELQNCSKTCAEQNPVLGAFEVLHFLVYFWMYHIDSAQRALIVVLEPLGNAMVVEPVAALAVVVVVVL